MGKATEVHNDLLAELHQLREENTRLNESIKESKNFFDVIAETASEMFWSTDASHRFTYISPRVVKLVDLAINFQLGSTRQELSNEDTSSEKWQKHLADLEAHRPFDNFVYTRKSSNGDIRYVTTTGRPIFDSDGQFKGYVGTSEDITDRVSIEKKAKSAETMLMTAINSLEVIFAIWGPDDRLVFANDHFHTLNKDVSNTCQVNVTFEEHYRAVVENGLTHETGDPEENIQKRLEQHRNPTDLLEVKRQDGITILVNEARLEDGSTITLSTDITSQKDIQNALRISEQRLRDFGTAGADWFWEMDADFRFTYISEDNFNVTGQNPESYIGMTRRELGLENVSEKELQAHEQTMLRREPFNDFRYSRKNDVGQDVFASINGVPVFSDDGTFIGYRGVGRNITDMVKTEHKLRHQMEIAEQANRTKSEFLAHMSHELRTPLNAILGFSEIIRQQSFGPVGNDTYVEYASDINDSGKHLLSLINDLLDLSKIEAGKFELDEEKLDLEKVIEQSERLLSHRFEERKIKYQRHIADDARHLFSDRRAITQILYNLLSNAEKFTEDGGEITISTRLGDAGGIEMYVKDTGCGFELNEVSTALMPFGRVENPMTKATPGTGLGLPIVKALMELHSGTIEIDSELNVGTLVKLIFPPERSY